MQRTIILNKELKLRAIVNSDAYSIFRIIDQQRDYLAPWLQVIRFSSSLEDTKEFVQLAVNDWKDKQEFVYKICYNDRLIGLIGTQRSDLWNKSTEIGYWLDQNYQGRGIMRKALSALCQALFKHRDIERIQLSSAPENLASLRTAKAVGFLPEGTKRNAEWLGGDNYRDLVLLSLLKSEQL